MDIQFFWKDIIAKCEKLGKKIVPAGKTSTSYKIYCDRGQEDLKQKDELRKAKWNATKKFFDLDDDDDTFSLFKQAATGLELQRITQLNSSSLFAFLFFHSVAKNGVKIKGKGFEHTGKFTHVTFEVNNTIQVTNRPISHIDVVLSNEKIALLLECKFSEYLEHYSRSSEKVSMEAYGAFYHALVNNGGVNGLKIDESTDTKNKRWITLKGDGKKPCYVGGLKQTIAHFMGAHGILNNGPNHNELNLEDKELHLAEVVFDFSSFTSLADEGHRKVGDALKSYKELHNSLCEKLAQIDVPDRRKVTVHTELLSYQNNFELELPRTFADLYRLPNLANAYPCQVQ